MARERQVELNLASQEAPANGLWLDSLEIANGIQDWGEPKARRSLGGDPITLRGEVYPHGVGANASSTLLVDLAGAAREFHAVVGVDDSAGDKGSATFEIWVDGECVERTSVLRGGGETVRLSVDVSGAKLLELLTDCTDDGPYDDHVDWAGALLILDPAAQSQPRTLPIDSRPLPVAMEKIAEPRINYPRITGATPGRPFLFRVPASGEGPLRFSADQLPLGLELDSDSGVISGALAEFGEWDVKVTVASPRGKDEQTLTIVGGHRKLALTPPMGWNSWNVFGGAVTDEDVRNAAKAMAESELAAHGYQYVNIDDCWMGKRSDDGRIQTNEKFPDMKGLVDYVHSLGLKIGTYTSPGSRTCMRYEGSFNHELQDAKTYAEWGFDYLKYDLCEYHNRIKDKTNLGEQQRPYLVMRAALDAVDRDIVYSLCQYGLANVSTWGRDVGGNVWRTTGDILDTWSSLYNIGFMRQAGLETWAGPGGWNDPDMLVVGVLGWGEHQRPTRLTRNEQIAHITLWALLAAPLLTGCDLTRLDEFTLALLTNDEVIAVNQDRLGRQARRISDHGRTQVWARPLADGGTAVGLFNLANTPTTVGVAWEQLGLAGAQKVRNLWTHEDLGQFETGYRVEIPRHGAVFLKVTD